MNSAEIILKLIELLAAVSPKFVETWTGSESVEEAIARARAAIPDMVTDGWDEDFERRINQIRESEESDGE